MSDRCMNGCRKKIPAERKAIRDPAYEARFCSESCRDEYLQGQERG